MHLIRIRCFRQWQPFADGTYSTAGGSAEGFDSLIVAVDTDEGVTGWGEMAPLGAFYAARSRPGTSRDRRPRARVLGADPRQPRRLVRRMDSAMRGQPYVKSALDMACWDAAARFRGSRSARPSAAALASGRPATLARRRPGRRPRPPLARRYASAGYRRLQVKVGGDPHTDAQRLAAVRDAVGPDVVLFADANGGWTDRSPRPPSCCSPQPRPRLHARAAVRDARGVRGAAAALPPPAHPGRVDRRAPRARPGRARGHRRRRHVKIARVGGVTRAATLRDLAVELGMTVTVEDTGGATIDTAAMLHLSLSTPEPHGSIPSTSPTGSPSTTPTASRPRRRRAGDAVGPGLGSTSARGRSASRSTSNWRERRGVNNGACTVIHLELRVSTWSGSW